MLVETGSVASVDVADTSDDGRSDAGKVPSVIGSETAQSAVEPPSREDTSQDQAQEAEREVNTQKELDAYEQDQEDPTAAPRGLSTPTKPIEGFARTPSPVLSTFPPLDREMDDRDPLAVTVGHPPARMRPLSNAEPEALPADEPDYLDEAISAYETPDANVPPPVVSQPPPQESLPPPSPSVPKIKCSDCGTELDLMELVEHSCVPSTSAPALSTAPSSPESYRTSPTSPNLPTASMFPEVPADVKRTGSGGSSKFSQKMDAFVAHTSSLVPDDVDAEDDEDQFVKPAELADLDDLESPGDKGGFTHVRKASEKSFDFPEDIDDDFGDERLTREGARGTPPARTKSLSKSRLPDDTDDDEEGYEGGSVTIVRTTHR
jgi:hypothetical protein